MCRDFGADLELKEIDATLAKVRERAAKKDSRLTGQRAGRVGA